VSVGYKGGSNLRKEKMNEILPTLLEFIDRIGYKFGQAGTLTYPDFVVWKGFEMYLDVQRLRSGITLNAHAKPFRPLKLSFPQKHDSQYKNDYHHRNNKSESRDVLENILESIGRNDTLQDYQYNQKLPRNDDLWIEVKNGIKTDTNISKQVTKVNHSNPYQLLDENDSEVSTISNQTTKISNVPSSENIAERDNDTTKKDYDIETIATVKMNEIINEFLADEKSELREINRICSRITERLNFQHNRHTEDLLLKHKQRIIRLETMNYECHRCIGELLSVLDNPREKVAFQTGLQKGFLLNKRNEDGRKKLFETESVTSQSTGSTSSNFDSLDGYEQLKYEKGILGIRTANKTLNIRGNEIEYSSDESDDYDDNNELYC